MLKTLHTLLPLLLFATVVSAQDTPPANLPVETAGDGLRIISSTPGCDYVVQEGDTLWDLAIQFQQDAFQYRSLWSVNNQEITNPHYIYPGQCVNFTPRARPRTLDRTVASEPDIVDTEWNTAEVDDEWEAKSISWKRTDSPCKVPIPFTAYEKRIDVLAPGFVESTERLPSGEVIAAKEDRESLTTGDIIFMRFQNIGEVRCGDVFSLYRPVGPARHPHARKSVLGYIYQVVGEVQVRTVQGNTVSGEIIKAWDVINRDTFVTERETVRTMISLKEPAAEIDGVIIGKLEAEGNLFFQDEVIFIDRGRQDNVQTGDRFWVVRRGDELDPASRMDDELPDYIVGKAVVVKAGEYMSTAIMVDQDRPLEVGDRITSHVEIN